MTDALQTAPKVTFSHGRGAVVVNRRHAPAVVVQPRRKPSPSAGSVPAEPTPKPCPLVPGEMADAE